MYPHDTSGSGALLHCQAAASIIIIIIIAYPAKSVEVTKNEGNTPYTSRYG